MTYKKTFSKYVLWIVWFENSKQSLEEWKEKFLSLKSRNNELKKLLAQKNKQSEQLTGQLVDAKKQFVDVILFVSFFKYVQ